MVIPLLANQDLTPMLAGIRCNLSNCFAVICVETMKTRCFISLLWARDRAESVPFQNLVLPGTCFSTEMFMIYFSC